MNMSDNANLGEATFQLPPDIIEIQNMARRIVREELMPVEQQYLPSDWATYGAAMENLRGVFDKKTVDRLVSISKETGLWDMTVPEEHGGSGMGLLAQVVVSEELNYCAVPFPMASVPNILYEARGEQVERLLKPVIAGEKTACFAQTEPDAGSDPGGMMKTRATRTDGGWLINGTKMWISNAHSSDLMQVQAVTDPEKRQRGGITMFIVDRQRPGLVLAHTRVPVP